MNKKLGALLMATSAVAILAGCQQTASNSNNSSEVVATIGDQKITQEDFYKEMKQSSGATVLRSLILQNVFEQHVSNAAELKKKADEDVAKQVEQSGGAEVFEQMLAQENQGSIENFKRTVYVSYLFKEVVNNASDATPENVKAFYENDYQGKIMKASHILVETEEEALAVIERLNNGEDFAEVAKEVSKDPGSAQRGGDLGEFPVDKMVPEFAEAIKKMKNGEVSKEPVKSQFGYHIIKVEDNGQTPYDKLSDEQKEAIKQAYLDTKFADQVFSLGVVSDLVNEAKVDIKDSDLKDAIDDLRNFSKQAKEAEDKAKEAEQSESKESTEESTTEESSQETTESTDENAQDSTEPAEESSNE